MPFIFIDWSKPQDGDCHTAILPQELSCEGGVVLHGSLFVHPGSDGKVSIATCAAVALAEVNAVDDLKAMLFATGPEGGPPYPVRAMVHATRLRLRHGEPLILLHPFSEVEPLFRAYRMRREMSA